MYGTVVMGVVAMFRALSTAGDRRLMDLTIRRAAASGGNVTSHRIPNPTPLLSRSPLPGLLAALSLLGASALVPALAQEPVPEPVVEDALPEAVPISR